TREYKNKTVTGQDATRLDATRLDAARLDATGLDATGLQVTGQDVTREDKTDFYELLLPPKLGNGRYILSIREFERESSHLDQMRLIAVDHSASTGVAVLPDGQIIQYVQPFTLADDACRCNDNAVRLSGMEGSAIRPNPHDTIALKFQSGLPEYANLSDSMEGGLLLGGWVVRGKDNISSGKPYSVGGVTAIQGSIGTSLESTSTKSPALGGPS